MNELQTGIAQLINHPVTQEIQRVVPSTGVEMRAENLRYETAIAGNVLNASAIPYLAGITDSWTPTVTHEGIFEHGTTEAMDPEVTAITEASQNIDEQVYFYFERFGKRILHVALAKLISSNPPIFGYRSEDGVETSVNLVDFLGEV